MACDLVVTSVTPIAPTAAGGLGSVEIRFTTSSTLVFFEVSGPVSLNFGLILASSGVAFGNYTLPPGGPYTYTLRQQNDDTCTATGTFTVPDFVPVPGCTDEYADNFDPAATVSNNSCTYSPRWRSAWQPMAVRVAAVAGQTTAFIEAKLRVGFRPGHPLAAVRPLGDLLTVRATVAPDGYATFCLGQYVRPLLGAPDGAGGYRLDLTSATAFTSDLYVGYELRRAAGTLLEHGYALNAAVPDAQIANTGELLSPFADRIPVWPNIHFEQPLLGRTGTPRQYGVLTEREPLFGEYIILPCPSNPLPVAWLAPGGGYGYWVFQGKPALADTVAEGQRYREASSGESRWSERGEARRSYTASSGPFRGAALAEGLATLARSPQVWVMPVVGGPWVAVTLEAGTFPVRTWGVLRNELKGIIFTEAAAQYAQGQ